MKNTRLIVAAATAMLTMAQAAEAQDKLAVTADADIVSHYMWRGTDKGGITIIPEARMEWKGASLKLQGTAGIDNDDPKEIDLTLGYKCKFFNIGLTDYWTSGNDLDGHNLYFAWDPAKNAHQMEANIGVDLGFLSLQVYTMVGGNDFKYSSLADTELRTNGKRAYSTYIEVRVPFAWKGLEWDVKAGLTPAESACTIEGEEVGGYIAMRRNHYYADQFSMVMASVRATKRLNICNAKVPVFVEVHTNPYLKRANFLVGFTAHLF